MFLIPEILNNHTDSDSVYVSWWNWQNIDYLGVDSSLHTSVCIVVVIEVKTKTFMFSCPKSQSKTSRLKNLWSLESLLKSKKTVWRRLGREVKNCGRGKITLQVFYQACKFYELIDFILGSLVKQECVCPIKRLPISIERYYKENQINYVTFKFYNMSRHIEYRKLSFRCSSTSETPSPSTHHCHCNVRWLALLPEPLTRVYSCEGRF